MERPGAVARLFMAIVAFAERQNVKRSKLGNPCVYDNAAFPWAAGIEREWRAIRDELGVKRMQFSRLNKRPLPLLTLITNRSARSPMRSDVCRSSSERSWS